MTLIAYVRPRHVWFSFPCGCWGPWSRFNMSKGGSCREKIVAQRAKARRHLHAVTEAWALQTALGGHCHCENPLTSEAWGELCLGEKYMTFVLTNVPWVFVVQKLGCQSSSRPDWSPLSVVLPKACSSIDVITAINMDIWRVSIRGETCLA